MCGIAGIVAGEWKPGDRETAERMIRRIRHRGPDSTGVFQEGGCTLSHARLSIIDLAGGDQPMANEDGTLHITFNGEIYNYLELRAELLGQGHVFATRSDTEVILHLYEQWGEECVSRMNGQWAFAIWNSRDRTLFISRDRFGVRPFFFTWARSTFVFASEIKAIFEYAGLSRHLNVQALNEVFTFWHTIPPRTAFQGISELPPGNSATVCDGRIAIRPYWSPAYPCSAPAGNGSRSEGEYEEELLALLSDAVRLRLRADVPIGAYLSGGLDSSVIAGLIHRSGVSHLRTFSVRFDEDEYDEGPFQQEVVRSLGVEHQEIRCSDRSIGDAFPEAIWHIEKPILRTAPTPLFLLSGLVRQSGYKVVLTGEGSDEILGGYDIFKEAKVRAFWATHPDSKLRPLLLRRLYPYIPQIQSQTPAYLRAFFHINPADTESLFFSHLTRWRLTSKLKAFFSDDVRAELGRSDPLASLESELPTAYREWTSFSRAQYLESRYLLPGYILSSQGDRVSMAHSVEGRFPFLDHRVAEFASRLPSNLKMKGLNEKYLLKRCARDLVPAAVLKRSKQPYRAPDARSFFCPGRHEYVQELLSPRQIVHDGIFNPVAVGKLVEKALNGAMPGVADNMAIVGILSTQLLMQRFSIASRGTI